MPEDPFSFITKTVIPFLVQGIGYTLELSMLSLAIGLVLGLICALMRLYGPRSLAWIVEAYISIIRGTPSLVQLFVVYYGLASIGIIFDRFSAGLLALSLNSSAYQSEYLRGAIKSVGSGQMQAAQALGFTRAKAVWNVILPQGLRFALPAWSNEGTYLIKGSSIVFIIGSLDLTAYGKILNGIYFRPLEIFFVVAALYVIMVFAFSKTVSFFGKRYRIPGYSWGQNA